MSLFVAGVRDGAQNRKPKSNDAEYMKAYQRGADVRESMRKGK